VAITARRGRVVVRSGKGDAYREVPLNAPARAVLEPWWRARRRATADGDGEPALFTNRRGGRLSARSIESVVARVGGKAGLALTPHVLRHTCVTLLVRAGHDLVLVAELAGHRRLETTRRYSLPSASDRAAAMDALAIEH
jgi:site-specific recombinase XerD